MRYKQYSKSQLEELANDLNREFDIERLEKAKVIKRWFIDCKDWKY